MKKKFLTGVALSVLIIGMLSASHAAALTLSFDDVTSGNFAYPLQSVSPDYGGLTWSEYWGVLRGAYHTGSGYEQGVVSGEYVAYNGGAQPVVITGSTFDFSGAYLTSAWTNTLDILVQGYGGGSLLYSQTVQAVNSQPTWFSFNYTGVDELRFFSTSSIFAMDDFIFDFSSPVPEPATAFLLGSGIAIISAARIKRKKQAALS